MDNITIINNLIHHIKHGELEWNHYKDDPDMGSSYEEHFVTRYNIKETKKSFRIVVTQRFLNKGGGNNYYMSMYIDKKIGKTISTTKSRTLYYSDYHDIFLIFVLIKYKYYLK